MALAAVTARAGLGDRGTRAQRPRTRRRPPGGSRCVAGDSLTTTPERCSRPSPPTKRASALSSWRGLVRRRGRPRADRQDERSRVAVDKAVARFEQLDAVRDVDRVVPALRNLGDRGPVGRLVALFWMDSLRPRERVVELAVTGLTNREIAERLFVSRRTARPTSSTCSRSSVTATEWSSPPTPPAQQPNHSRPPAAPKAPGAVRASRRTPPPRPGRADPAHRRVDRVQSDGDLHERIVPRPRGGRIGQPTDLVSHLGQVTDVCEPATAHAGGRR